MKLSMKSLLPLSQVVIGFHLSLLAVAADKHVHGAATLMLSGQGQQLEIMLESPAANLVGFEYHVSTPEQQATVEKVTQQLQTPSTLFAFNGSDCLVSSVNVDMSAVSQAQTKHHSDDDKQHDEHDKHPHMNVHKSSKKSVHSNITASYMLNCNRPISQIKSINILLMKQFKAIDELTVQWVMENHQGQKRLNHRSHLIRLDK